jgi:hypothetical protein
MCSIIFDHPALTILDYNLMMRNFIPNFKPSSNTIADDETTVSSSRKDDKESFRLENKIWILKNHQAKLKITKNVSSSKMIKKLKRDIGQTQDKNREIYLKY